MTHSDYCRRWRAKNRKKINAYQRQWAAKHKEQRKAYDAGRKDSLQDSHFQRRYGISRLEYQKLLMDQNGVCAVCGRKASRGRYAALQVDHDHSTGRIRGLLCWDCNLGLGRLGDSADSLRRALQYLERT